ncbi:hypothetical protein [Streptomyces sp. NPDC059909]
MAARKDAGVPRTITLINGDKVTVTGGVWRAGAGCTAPLLAASPPSPPPD